MEWLASSRSLQAHWRYKAVLVAACTLAGASSGQGQCDILTREGVRDLGYSVSLSGESMLLGAPALYGAAGLAGSAHVYTGGPAGWALAADLAASDPHQGDEFGYAVGVVGTQAVVGAPAGDGPVIDSGTAYLFEDQSGVWVERQRLAPPELMANARFGASVAMDGGTLLIGAPHFGLDAALRSAVFVYTNTGISWARTDTWTGSSSMPGDFFGGSLAVAGRWAAVGAQRDDDGGTDAGAVYIFEWGGGVWQERTKLLASDSVADARFGWDLALSGSTLVVGACFSDNGGTSRGQVYFFEESAGLWTERANMDGQTLGQFDNLGTSVAVSGDWAAAGAPYGDGVLPGTGTLTFFERGPTGWAESGWRMDPTGTNGDRFGHALALDASGLSSALAVGAVGQRVTAVGNGAAHVLDVSADDGDDDGLQDSCQCVASAYCPGAPNSTGPGATMGYLGSLSVADNALYLISNGASAGSMGLFLYGDNQIAAPLGDGTLCVGSPQFRLGLAMTDGIGGAILPIDISAPPSAAGQIQAYATWNFQFWFRDLAAGGAGHNLSEGMAITFCP